MAAGREPGGVGGVRPQGTSAEVFSPALGGRITCSQEYL